MTIEKEIRALRGAVEKVAAVLAAALDKGRHIAGARPSTEQTSEAGAESEAEAEAKAERQAEGEAVGRECQDHSV